MTKNQVVGIAFANRHQLVAYKIIRFSKLLFFNFEFLFLIFMKRQKHQKVFSRWKIAFVDIKAAAKFWQQTFGLKIET